MSEDLERILAAREESFFGLCSTRVIDTSYLASTLIDSEKSETLVGSPLEITLQKEGYIPKTARFQVQISRFVSEGDEWTRLDLFSEDTLESVELATLQDRSKSERCSVAVFEPYLPAVKDFADRVVAVENDHDKPFDFNSEEGKLTYTAEAVETLYKYLEDPNNLVSRENFIKTFQIEDLVKYCFNIDLERDYIFPDGVNQDALRYLFTSLKNKLTKMEVGENVILSKEIGEIPNAPTKGITASYSTEVSFTKITDHHGQIDWDVFFGDQNKILAENDLRPSVRINTLNDGTPAFISLSESLDLTNDQLQKLTELARLEGFRQVVQLPRATRLEKFPLKIYGEEICFFDKSETEIVSVIRSSQDDGDKINIDKIFSDLNWQNFRESLKRYRSSLDAIKNRKLEYKISDNIGEALSQLSNHIAYLNEGKHPDVINDWETLGDLVAAIQKKFGEQIDLLDLGTLYLPGVPDNKELLKNTKNIKAEIDAYGWTVLKGATYCSGVNIVRSGYALANSSYITDSKVSNSTNAFTDASFITDCQTDSVYYSFVRVKSSKDCVAETSNLAFADAINIKDCKAVNSANAFRIHTNITYENLLGEVDGYLLEDCVAVNCKKAFEKPKHSTKSLIREYLKNCTWLSQPGLIRPSVDRPHRIVNMYVGTKPDDYLPLYKRLSPNGLKLMLGSLESSQ